MLLLFAALTLHSPALAQPASEPSAEDVARAKELFRNGERLYNEGRYEDAIVAWQEAYDLSGQPALLYNMANAYERLGRYQESYDALNRYRVYASESEADAIDRRLLNLEQRLREQSPSTAPTQKAPPKAKTGGPPVLPIALYGVGAAGLGTGVAFALRAGNAREEAAGLCVSTEGGAICPDSAGPALSRDRSSSVLADIGFVVGVAGAAGGTALLLMGDDARVGLTPTTNGVLVSARF